MDEFAAACFCLGLFGLGVLTGNLLGTNDVTQKEIIEANQLCTSSEGLYKINKGTKEVTAFCKNVDKFILKGEK